MNDLTITTKLKVSDETLESIISTGVEGGINYWASITSKRFDDEKMKAGEVYYLEVAIQDSEDEDEAWTINNEVVLKGLQVWLSMDEEELGKAYSNAEHQQHAFRAIVTEDIGMLDAGDCDTIIQMGLFGKNVYG